MRNSIWAQDTNQFKRNSNVGFCKNTTFSRMLLLDNNFCENKISLKWGVIKLDAKDFKEMILVFNNEVQVSQEKTNIFSCTVIAPYCLTWVCPW